MNRYIPIIALALAIVWPEGGAHADGNPTCGSHDEAVKQLAEKFHESSKSQAITSAGTLLEVFRTDDGSTWTIVVTTPKGLSCVVAAGKEWADADAATPPAQPDPAPEQQGYPGVGDNARLDPHKQFDIKF
jgi:hypothetical protein